MTVLTVKAAIIIVASLIVTLYFDRCDAQPVARAKSAAVRTRGECRLAAQVIRTGHPEPRRAWAIERVETCGEDGPPALAARWQSITGPGSELDQLTRSSMRVRDGRLYAELLQAADDGSRPAPVRAAALLVLAKYVNPGSAVWLTDLIPPDSIGYISRAAGSTTNDAYSEGAHPMPQNIGPAVLAVLQRLAADRTRQPRHVWYAAARLAQRVEADLRYQALHPRYDD